MHQAYEEFHTWSADQVWNSCQVIIGVGLTFNDIRILGRRWPWAWNSYGLKGQFGLLQLLGQAGEIGL